MAYVLTDGGSTIVTYPYNIGLLRRDNPNVSFPASMADAALADWNMFPVQPTQKPAFNPLTHECAEGKPENENGQWRQTWTVNALSEYAAQAAHDDAMNNLRADRDEMLRVSDWTQMPDAPLTPDQRAAWVKYRQALRDVPENTTDPLNPVWPVQP
jgi:hypothetical protein